MTISTPDISALLADVSCKGSVFNGNKPDENAQKALLESARSLVAALESPFEVIHRMNWLEPTRWAVTRVGLDIGLFEALVADDASPKTVAQLAETTKIDPKLMMRFMRHLNSAGFVKETGKGEYTANGISAALATRVPAGMTKQCYTVLGYANPTMVEFLRETGYKNPTDRDFTPFSYGAGTELRYFDWLSQPGKEANLDDFNAHMEFKMRGKNWFETVDVAALFDNPTDPSRALMVDIGGSTGHDSITFRNAFPDLPGKVVLQELPMTINALPKDFPTNLVEPQAHDFYTPQPVKGAKAYFLHHILHDWPDENGKDILRNIIPAMEKGYSKILLKEMVVPDQGANWFQTSLDMTMLSVHAARERTESDWAELVGDVGLKITKIWPCNGEPEKIIELDLV